MIWTIIYLIKIAFQFLVFHQYLRTRKADIFITIWTSIKFFLKIFKFFITFNAINLWNIIKEVRSIFSELEDLSTITFKIYFLHQIDTFDVMIDTLLSDYKSRLNKFKISFIWNQIIEKFKQQNHILRFFIKFVDLVE